MDFLEFVRKQAEERKERGLVQKGGKGSGWFAPPEGTHTGQHGKRGESLAGRRETHGKKATRRDEKRVLVRAAGEQLRDVHNALSTDWRSLEEVADKAKLPVKNTASTLALFELKDMAEMKREGTQLYYRAKAKAGKERQKKIPESHWDGKPKKLTSFQESGGRQFSAGQEGTTNITRYGSLVFVESKYGANRYGKLYTSNGKRILTPFSKEPISGRVKEAKEIVRRIAQITDWSQLDKLAKPQVDMLQDKVIAELSTFKKERQ